jgi:hypothetical protein
LANLTSYTPSTTTTTTLLLLLLDGLLRLPFSFPLDPELSPHNYLQTAEIQKPLLKSYYYHYYYYHYFLGVARVLKKSPFQSSFSVVVHFNKLDYLVREITHYCYYQAFTPPINQSSNLVVVNDIST